MFVDFGGPAPPRPPHLIFVYLALLISIITVCSCSLGAFTCSSTRSVLFGGSAAEEKPIQVIRSKMKPNMTPLALLAACVLGVCALSHVEEMKSQELLFLGSLGLSERPMSAESQKPWRHVPFALWRMFRRSENIQAQESDPCMVSEYGVRGNIIRYVQDQGSVYTAPRAYAGVCLLTPNFDWFRVANKGINQIFFRIIYAC